MAVERGSPNKKRLSEAELNSQLLVFGFERTVFGFAEGNPESLMRALEPVLSARWRNGVRSIVDEARPSLKFSADWSSILRARAERVCIAAIPAQLSLVTEESPFSINDASCATTVNPASPGWIDFPSTLHNNACVINFADGHAELHKWTGSSMFLSGPATSIVRVQPTDPDWIWFSQRTSARF